MEKRGNFWGQGWARLVVCLASVLAWLRRIVAALAVKGTHFSFRVAGPLASDEGLAGHFLTFRPAMVRLQSSPPSPLGRLVLVACLSFLAILLVWGFVGRLDIVAVAQGKLVPKSQLKIVQPFEGGIVKEILVHEGEMVRQGQTLMRMDGTDINAQRITLENNRQNFSLALRRIDAELSGQPFVRQADDPLGLFAEIQAQYQANRAAQTSLVAEQQSLLEKAQHDLVTAQENKSRVEEALPHYQRVDDAFEILRQRDAVAELDAMGKHRERMEKEREFSAQESILESVRSEMQGAEKQLDQVQAEYHRRLQTERVETTARLTAVEQELAKTTHRQTLLELTAPQAGVIKDLATHTVGTVVSPGTILMTLVPQNEDLQAEVWVSNKDIGFVSAGQAAKLKLTTFNFQKYGMVDGVVEKVGADSSAQTDTGAAKADDETGGLVYKSILTLESQFLTQNGQEFRLAPGMELSAEIKLGTRSVMEYLFSPVAKTVHEACRER